jgi:site-specific DNA recombinase
LKNSPVVCYHDLIEKIVIHEGDKSSGHRQQKIDIYYTFIGEVGATQLVAQLELKGKAA